jgi:hypothetical protein
MWTGTAFAQSLSMSVSVTPPLLQLTIGPGESWSSALKVVNSNPYDATYYASVVDFAAKGENGEGTFMPIIARGTTTPNSYSLASWLTLPQEPVTVPAGRSADIPFTVNVPADAEPGGHYAAVLIGTDPGGIRLAGPTMRIASYVSSLIFVKIRGETTEQGRIREFRTDATLYDVPSAEFVLRFENTGNTHLKPQGDITIFNMWGKERGELAVNADNGNFGNVLPHSTRKFAFSWTGDTDLLDVGRYSAVVTLAYGDEGKKNISAVTYFWVVPTVPVATTLIAIVGVLGLLWWLIRRYIRRALEIERGRLAVPESAAQSAAHASIGVLLEPIREGVVDLRRATISEGAESARPTGTAAQPLSFLGFVRKYRLFFLFILVLSIAGWGTFFYLHKVMISSRNFQITDVKIEEEATSSDVRIVP